MIFTKNPRLLKHASIKHGDVAVSNTVVSSPFSIRVDSGDMLVLILHEQARRVS